MTTEKKITREEAKVMSDRELLAAVVAKRSPGSSKHKARELILRNGRWGTCSGCHRDERGAHPEICVCTNRYDHNIDVTKDGKFYSYDREVPKFELINILLT